MDSTLLRKALCCLAATAASLASHAQVLNHEVVAPPLAPGRFVVACSNIEQDTSRLAALGGLATDYWEGQFVDGRARYLTEILAQPQTALVFSAAVPDRRTLYPRHAGESIPFAAIVCHPTSRTNTDPGYVLPGTGDTVPRMQRPGAEPKLVSVGEYHLTLGQPVPAGDTTVPARLPLIVYSHGLSGSPIGKGYINVMVQLAAQGYMVAAVFHGDPRFSRVRIEDLSDFTFALLNFDRVVEMQLLRPVALKAMLDTVLSRPGFARGIDPERIGGFGASMGGAAMAHLLGARITATVGLHCEDTETDARIKAAVGFVPYAGYSLLPAFCDDQSGAQGVNRPYLAMSGTADNTAPAHMMRQAVNRFSSSAYFVEMIGGEHELRPEDAGDVLTWTLTFLNAYLGAPHDPGAMARLIRMRGVQGGREDNLLVDVHIPFANTGGEVRAVEFHNTILDHYFVAAGPSEVAGILAGAAGQGWVATGQSFKAWLQMPPDTFVAAAPVCRFYGAPAGGPNSHFFTAESSECELVKRSGGWFYEGIGFHIRPVGSDGRCPDGLLAVNRAYNMGFPRNDSNHRFSTSDSTMREMQRRGWVIEGAVMCARP